MSQPPIDDRFQKDWRHWTPQGLFEIKNKVAAGSWLSELYFKGEYLGCYSHPNLASDSITIGEHDEKIGVPGASLNIPYSVYEWNGFS